MANKITIFMKVYWPANGRILEGKVKKIMSDHAIVHAEGTDYLVQKAALSTKPIEKGASFSVPIQKYASGHFNSSVLPGRMFKTKEALIDEVKKKFS